jgi:hypothetical protein
MHIFFAKSFKLKQLHFLKVKKNGIPKDDKINYVASLV